MPVREIRLYGDPVLNSKCDAIKDFGDKAKALIEDLIDTTKSITNQLSVQSKDLTDILCDIFTDQNMELNINFEKKKKKLLNEIDYLDVLVNTLNNEVDMLSAQVNKIQDKLN